MLTRRWSFSRGGEETREEDALNAVERTLSTPADQRHGWTSRSMISLDYPQQAPPPPRVTGGEYYVLTVQLLSV